MTSLTSVDIQEMKDDASRGDLTYENTHKLLKHTIDLRWSLTAALNNEMSLKDRHHIEELLGREKT